MKTLMLNENILTSLAYEIIAHRTSAESEIMTEGKYTNPVNKPTHTKIKLCPFIINKIVSYHPSK